MLQSSICLNDQHAIAVAVEAHFFFHRLCVCVKDNLSGGECGDEHQEGAFRQVKIGEQHIYGFGLIRRVDENIG